MKNESSKPAQKQALRKTDVSGSVLEQIRQAFADYRRSEGCSCCRDMDAHEEAEKRLAELLKPEPYEDGSGWDWSKYCTERVGGWRSLLKSLHQDLKGFQEMVFLTPDVKTGLGIAIEQVERYMRNELEARQQ